MQNTHKTSAVWKFDLLQFWWFNLFLDWFFKESTNLQTKMADSVCGTCYTPNSDGGTRSRSGDLLRFGWSNLHLNPFFEEIPNLKREILNSHCSSQYEQIGGGHWEEGQVTSFQWDDLYIIWTSFQRRIWIWRGHLHIWPLTITMGVLIFQPSNWVS
jgi:hypothetical protein